MGRIGLSYETFAKAAYALLENNAALKVDDITIEKVRATLKTGSHGTLGPYLKKWKSEVTKGEKWVGKHLDEEMEVLTSIYDKLKAEANTKVTQIQEEARLAVEAATQALVKASNENDWLQNAMEERDKQIAEIQHEKTIAAAENIKLKEVCETLNFQLSEKRNEVQRLIDINKSLSANLESFHDASASEIQKLELKHERELGELKNEISELREAKERLQADLAETKTENGIWCTRAEEREKAVSTLTEINKNAEEKITGYSKEIIGLNSDLITIRKDFNDLSKEFEAIEKENHDKISELYELEQNLAKEINLRSELQKQLQHTEATVELLSKKMKFIKSVEIVEV